MSQETIYALSSGAAPSAIAIVRVSGERAREVLEALSGRVPPARRATLASLKEPNTGDLLDNALVLFFPGPASATGEDIVELHLHGGRSVVRTVLATLAKMEGLREARPGEFTRRGFENGRIDLAEAEGLADLLTSETETQRKAALALAGGALGKAVQKWQAMLLALSAEIEAVLDFSDEDDVGGVSPATQAALTALADEVRAALAWPSAERLRDGIRVAIAGPPNAGKSSLLNCLIGREAAITSDIAGTTRDLIEAPVAIGGTPFLFIDTAGIRSSNDRIEAIGVERARSAVEAADLVLWLGPLADAPPGERTIKVRAKADLDPEPASAGYDVSVSCRIRSGLENLFEILRMRTAKLLPADGEVALNARHRNALTSALSLIEEAEREQDLILTAELLRQARASFTRITGGSGVEDMLDALFGRFCIGK